MPAKSFIGAAEEAALGYYATMLRREMSDANVRAYLAAASQVAEIWQEIDDRLGQLQHDGATPWDALVPPLDARRAKLPGRSSIPPRSAGTSVSRVRHVR